jgi:hypothetical protein
MRLSPWRHRNSYEGYPALMRRGTGGKYATALETRHRKHAALMRRGTATATKGARRSCVEAPGVSVLRLSSRGTGSS